VVRPHAVVGHSVAQLEQRLISRLVQKAEDQLRMGLDPMG
jgi:hypothetical protein